MVLAQQLHSMVVTTGFVPFGTSAGWTIHTVWSKLVVRLELPSLGEVNLQIDREIAGLAPFKP